MSENPDHPGDQPANEPRIRKYKVFDLKFANLNSTAVFWSLGFDNDQFTITINDNHVFYSQIWVNLDETARTSMAFLLASIAQSQYEDMKHSSFSETHDGRDSSTFWERFWSDVSIKLRHLIIS